MTQTLSQYGNVSLNTYTYNDDTLNVANWNAIFGDIPLVSMMPDLASFSEEWCVIHK